jgi:hypothetical protein
MEKHARFAIANGFCCGIMASLKLSESDVCPCHHVIGILLERGAPITLGGAALFLYEMVGQLSGKAFTPIAVAAVYKDAVPPPVMEDFMGIGGV